MPTNWAIVGTGDYNGDGKSDILWRDTERQCGDLADERHADLEPTATRLGTVPTNWGIVGTGDYNGDGKSDILWRDTSGTWRSGR